MVCVRVVVKSVRLGMSSKIDKSGRIIIPKEIRDLFDLKEGATIKMKCEKIDGEFKLTIDLQNETERKKKTFFD